MKFHRRLGGIVPLRLLVFLIWGVMIPVLSYGSLLAAAKSDFGVGRILGWDSLVYAFSAQETVSQGIHWLLQTWGHPNLYVLLLATVSILLNDLTLLTNVLPIGLVAFLSLGSGFLTVKLGKQKFAPLVMLLTVTSMATFRLFLDLHRALFSFAGITLLLALDSPKALSKVKLDRGGTLAIALLFLVAFSEFELYLAYLTASLVRLSLARENIKKGGISIGWSLLPGISFAFTPAGWIILGGLMAPSSGGVVKELTLELTLVYLSTVISLPFMILGFVVLVRNWKQRREGVSTLFLSWIITMFLIFLVLGFIYQKISPFRALILMHSPVLVALGAGFSTKGFLELLRRGSAALQEGHFLRISIPDQTGQVAFALVATSLVLVSGVGFYQNADTYLRPIVSEDLYARLELSSEYVNNHGWSEPVYLVLNESLIHILAPIRLELGLLNGPSFFYYGDLNFLPWVLPPDSIDPQAMESAYRSRILKEEYRHTTYWLDSDPFDLLGHPIVALSPELFPRTLPSSFQQFKVDEGLYVIPPNSLSLETFLEWEILAEEDSYDLGKSIIVERDWSLSGNVVEIYTKNGYEISFPHYYPVTGGYTLSIHLFDFPETDYNSTTLLSPLELLIGDEVISTLVYGRNEVVWWNVTLDMSSGLEVITLRAASTELPFRLSLDVIVVIAETP